MQKWIKLHRNADPDLWAARLTYAQLVPIVDKPTKSPERWNRVDPDSRSLLARREGTDIVVYHYKPYAGAVKAVTYHRGGRITIHGTTYAPELYCCGNKLLRLTGLTYWRVGVGQRVLAPVEHGRTSIVVSRHAWGGNRFLSITATPAPLRDAARWPGGELTLTKEGRPVGPQPKWVVGMKFTKSERRATWLAHRAEVVGGVQLLIRLGLPDEATLVAWHDAEREAGRVNNFSELFMEKDIYRLYMSACMSARWELYHYRHREDEKEVVVLWTFSSALNKHRNDLRSRFGAVPQTA